MLKRMLSIACEIEIRGAYWMENRFSRTEEIELAHP
jgi:hypothetical protein